MGCSQVARKRQAGDRVFTAWQDIGDWTLSKLFGTSILWRKCDAWQWPLNKKKQRCLPLGCRTSRTPLAPCTPGPCTWPARSRAGGACRLINCIVFRSDYPDHHFKWYLNSWPFQTCLGLTSIVIKRVPNAGWFCVLVLLQVHVIKTLKVQFTAHQTVSMTDTAWLYIRLTHPWDFCTCQLEDDTVAIHTLPMWPWHCSWLLFFHRATSILLNIGSHLLTIFQTNPFNNFICQASKQKLSFCVCVFELCLQHHFWRFELVFGKLPYSVRRQQRILIGISKEVLNFFKPPAHTRARREAVLCPPALLCRLAADLHPLLGPSAVQATQAGGALAHLVCNNDEEKCFFPA